VSSRAGLQPQPLIQGLLSSSSSSSSTNNKKIGGLIVVGSYVPKTTSQLEYLLQHSLVQHITIPIKDIILSYRDGDSITCNKIVETILDNITDHLTIPTDVVLSTSREFFPGASLEETKYVSDVVTEIVSSLSVKPGFIIAKGGITSHEIAAKVLQVRYQSSNALVLGQIHPGVPIWMLNASSIDSLDLFVSNDNYVKDNDQQKLCMPYVVFPGNVGDFTALAQVASKLGVKSRLRKLLASLKTYQRQKIAIPAFNICKSTATHPLRILK
jgi:uncharacterized protein YgbK (DUF1537 family)